MTKREINYDLCTAIDLTKLGIVLEKMVQLGLLTPAEKTAHFNIADNLLQVLRLANSK